MNVKISMFVACVEVMIYLLLCNLECSNFLDNSKFNDNDQNKHTAIRGVARASNMKFYILSQKKVINKVENSVG